MNQENTRPATENQAPQQQQQQQQQQQPAHSQQPTSHLQQRLQSLSQQPQQLPVPAPQPQAHQQQHVVNKPMEKDLNLNEYKNLIPKTIAELTAIQERGKKLYARRKFYRREPYPPPEKRQKTEEELKLEALQRAKDIAEYKNTISYSHYYYDDFHEYRHVNLPKMISRWLPIPNRVLTQKEWVDLGVSQSTGWEHYMIYAPEPHILLFRREIDYLRKHSLDNNPVQPEDCVKKEVKKEQVKIKLEKEIEPVTSEVAPVRQSHFRSSRLAARANIDAIRK